MRYEHGESEGTNSTGTLLGSLEQWCHTGTECGDRYSAGTNDSPCGMGSYRDDRHLLCHCRQPAVEWILYGYREYEAADG